MGARPASKVAAHLGSVRRRPLRGAPRRRAGFVYQLAIIAVVGTALAATHDPATMLLAWPWLAAAGLLVCETHEVSFGDGHRISFSEVFWITLFAVAPMDTAVATLVAYALGATLLPLASWDDYVNDLSSTWLFQGAILGTVATMRGLLDPAWLPLAAPAAALAYAGVYLTGFALGWRLMRGEDFRYRTMVLAGVPFMIIEVSAAAALSTLAIAAWSGAAWSLFALAVPYLLLLHVARQQDQLQRARSELAVDTLTGVASRSHFMQVASEELAAAERYGHDVALLLCDLDHFKGINDTHGHQVGDEALRAAAAALDAAAGANVHLARYGGEEFVAIVVAVSATDAAQVAEQMRAAAGTALARWGSSVSVGLALREPGEPLAALTARADAALYAAKAGGRDRVHSAAPTVHDRAA